MSSTNDFLAAVESVNAAHREHVSEPREAKLKAQTAQLGAQRAAARVERGAGLEEVESYLRDLSARIAAHGEPHTSEQAERAIKDGYAYAKRRHDERARAKRGTPTKPRPPRWLRPRMATRRTSAPARGPPFGAREEGRSP